MTEEEKRADVLKRIDEKIQKISNMSKGEQEEKIVRAVGAPSSAALAKIKWLQDWRAESIGRSTTRIL